MITGIISLMIRELDIDNNPVRFEPLWSHNYVMVNLGSLKHPSVHLYLLIAGLKSLWNAHIKRCLKEWYDPCRLLLDEVCLTISALYSELREKNFGSPYEAEAAKEAFMVEWRVSVLFYKNGRYFSPRRCLSDILEDL